MKKNRKLLCTLAFSAMLFFAVSTILETAAWARAGRGGSFGSRGSRSFSTPTKPATPSPGSPGIGAQRPNASNPGAFGQPSTGFFGRSPFLQGMAGGLAGGLLGSMLFGGTGHASAGGMGGGGMGLLDLVIIGLLLYLAWRFFKKRRAQSATAGYSGSSDYTRAVEGPGETGSYYRESQPDPYAPGGDLGRGFEQMRQFDPGFSEEALKEAFQDNFFRVQAAWMNRSLVGIDNIVTDEMAGIFKREFEAMKLNGTINRLENIAIRKVEPTEAWQEMGKDYVTVLITANLLDYTVDEISGEVVGGDKFNPVKFQEFWTFCRNIGSSQWELSAINQADETSSRLN